MKQTAKVKAKKANNDKALLKKRKIRFNSIQDIRRFLARTLNERAEDSISDGKARSLGYLLNIMKDCIVSGDLETRILKLENEALKNENN